MESQICMMECFTHNWLLSLYLNTTCASKLKSEILDRDITALLFIQILNQSP